MIQPLLQLQCVSLLLSLLLLTSAQDCLYQYISRPSTELRCDPLGSRLQLRCMVSGPLQPSFQVGWYRGSIDSVTGTQLNSLPEYTVVSNTLDTTGQVNAAERTISSTLITSAISAGIHNNGCLWCQLDFEGQNISLGGEKEHRLCFGNITHLSSLRTCNDMEVVFNSSSSCIRFAFNSELGSSPEPSLTTETTVDEEGLGGTSSIPTGENLPVTSALTDPVVTTNAVASIDARTQSDITTMSTTSGNTETLAIQTDVSTAPTQFDTTTMEMPTTMEAAADITTIETPIDATTIALTDADTLADTMETPTNTVGTLSIDATTEASTIMEATDADTEAAPTTMKMPLTEVTTVEIQTDADTIAATTDTTTMEVPTEITTMETPTDADTVAATTDTTTMEVPTEITTMETPTDADTVAATTDTTTTEIATMETPTDADTVAATTDTTTMEVPTEITTMETPTDADRVVASTDTTMEMPTDATTMEIPTDAETVVAPTDTNTMEMQTDVITIETPTDTDTVVAPTTMEIQTDATTMETLTDAETIVASTDTTTMEIPTGVTTMETPTNIETVAAPTDTTMEMLTDAITMETPTGATTMETPTDADTLNDTTTIEKSTEVTSVETPTNVEMQTDADTVAAPTNITTIEIPTNVTMETQTDTDTVAAPTNITTMETPTNVTTMETQTDADTTTMEMPTDATTMETPTDVTTMETPTNADTVAAPTDTTTMKMLTDAPTTMEISTDVTTMETSTDTVVAPTDTTTMEMLTDAITMETPTDAAAPTDITTMEMPTEVEATTDADTVAMPNNITTLETVIDTTSMEISTDRTLNDLPTTSSPTDLVANGTVLPPDTGLQGGALVAVIATASVFSVAVIIFLCIFVRVARKRCIGKRKFREDDYAGYYRESGHYSPYSPYGTLQYGTLPYDTTTLRSGGGSSIRSAAVSVNETVLINGPVVQDSESGIYNSEETNGRTKQGQNGHGIYGNQGQNGHGIYGNQWQNDHGIYGNQEQNGLGIYGNQEQNRHGIYGNQGQNGHGIYGNHEQNGHGIYGNQEVIDGVDNQRGGIYSGEPNVAEENGNVVLTKYVRTQAYERPLSVPVKQPQSVPTKQPPSIPASSTPAKQPSSVPAKQPSSVPSKQPPTVMAKSWKNAVVPDSVGASLYDAPTAPSRLPPIKAWKNTSITYGSLPRPESIPLTDLKPYASHLSPEEGAFDIPPPLPYRTTSKQHILHGDSGLVLSSPTSLHSNLNMEEALDRENMSEEVRGLFDDPRYVSLAMLYPEGVEEGQLSASNLCRSIPVLATNQHEDAGKTQSLTISTHPGENKVYS